MRHATTAVSVCLAAALCLACAGHLTRSPAEARPEEGTETRRPPDPELARAVDGALERLLAGGGREGLRILAECGDDGALSETVIYGSGVGVWNRSRQFALAPERVTALLERFRATGFAHFQELYGTIEQEIPTPGDAPAPSPERGAAALRVVCRVAFTADGITKQSSQLAKGPRSEELRALAERILAVGREAGASGVAAESLDDGLGKIASGTLAPEVLRLLVHRKPGTAPGDHETEGFLLRLEGGRATAQRFTARGASAGGYGEPRVLDLADREVVRLAGILAEGRVGELPVNLYAPYYTDVTAQVLDRKTQIQARRFRGMTPRTHGEAQRRFDRAYQELAALAERTLSEGRPEGG